MESQAYMENSMTEGINVSQMQLCAHFAGTVYSYKGSYILILLKGWWSLGDPLKPGECPPPRKPGECRARLSALEGFSPVFSKVPKNSFKIPQIDPIQQIASPEPTPPPRGGLVCGWVSGVLEEPSAGPWRRWTVATAAQAWTCPTRGPATDGSARTTPGESGASREVVPLRALCIRFPRVPVVGWPVR